MSLPAKRTARIAKIAALSIAAGALTGCYVVPLQPATAPSGAVVLPPAPPQPLTFSARLYPANDLASGYGMVAAVVTNDLNGRGHFSTAINGESFTGEATRVAGSSRDGVANGAGNRGSFLNCRYTMNSATLGTGTCRHSNGAAFTMHIGN
ncbi:hypothetical protein UC35_22575 [Ramlibacter tataouinensis]|uniref:Uncharacterized protein n=1 Tax=Ramlibacter tataouinensis TaxID=94132 RepID=A0A140HLE1_9BURK|nr:hypothetical protein UC35_22575 [Ramlibacter tataouinensis]